MSKFIIKKQVYLCVNGRDAPMELMFREKIEILQIPDCGLVETNDMSFFIFEYLAIDFGKYIQIEDLGKHDIEALFEEFCLKAIEISETFFFLVWIEIEGDLRENNIFDFPIAEKVMNSMEILGWVFIGRDNSFDWDNKLHLIKEILPLIFEKFLTIQKIFTDIIQFCLDRNSTLNTDVVLTPSHKWYIYTKILDDPKIFIEQFCDISEHTRIVPINELPKPGDHTGLGDQSESDNQMELNSDGHSDNFFNDPANSHILNEFIKSADTANIGILKTYRSNSVFGLLYAEFWNMIINNISIKRCAFCGKYFIPFSGNSEYCSRIIKDKNKTCKEYAPMFFHRKKQNDNDAAKIYKKADSAHYMRHKRNPGHYTWEQFMAWRKKAEALLEKALKDEMSIEDFKAAIYPNTIK